MDSNTLKLPSSALFLGRRQGRQPATKCCMCHNRVSARSSSNSKNLWGCLCSRVRLELSPDGYWTDRSGVCRRDLFVRPRAFDRGTPGAGATSSPVACRCSWFAAENCRTATSYPSLWTQPIGTRDLSRRFAWRAHYAVSRAQTGCRPGRRTIHERFTCENIQPTRQHLEYRAVRRSAPGQVPCQEFPRFSRWSTCDTSRQRNGITPPARTLVRLAPG